MKKCSFCQTDNTDDAKYCKGCGKALAQPLPELSEREILLQIRDLLDKGGKQTEDYQREYREYQKWSRQNIDGINQRTEKAQRENRRFVLLLVCLLIVFIIVSLALSVHH